MRYVLSLWPPGKSLASQLITTLLWILKVWLLMCMILTNVVERATDTFLLQQETVSQVAQALVKN